ncbi:MAG: SDR family NAD(P)-dependent oxidoreductase [Thermoleophilia bacterium]|jgi:NAD(P)-dependent dehydrogenase (short-subunit alcohol dehydrogenase family)
MARLSDKVAVITGAGSGLGLATTKRFVEEGARVLAVDLDQATLDAVVAEVGPQVSGFAADVTDPAQVETMLAAAVQRYGGIDVLLPNAGIWGTVADIANYPIDTFKRVIDVNLTSVFYTMKFGLPLMVERGGGSIVLTSSAGGTGGKPGNVAYAATKHAVQGMMRTAAVEYAPAGIRVNAVLPGVIETPMIHQLERTFSPDDPAKGAADLAASSLMKRYGTPREVADLMLFLACDESSFCTGASYYVDGGFQLA